jgi:hypothetical protein
VTIPSYLLQEPFDVVLKFFWAFGSASTAATTLACPYSCSWPPTAGLNYSLGECSQLGLDLQLDLADLFA